MFQRFKSFLAISNSLLFLFKPRSSKAIKNDETIIRCYRVLIATFHYRINCLHRYEKRPDNTSRAVKGLVRTESLLCLADSGFHSSKSHFEIFFQSWLIDIKIIHNFYTSNLNYFYIIVGEIAAKEYRGSVLMGPVGILYYMSIVKWNVFSYSMRSVEMGEWISVRTERCKIDPSLSPIKFWLKIVSRCKKVTWDG